MTQAKLKELTDKLGAVLMHEFEFNGIKIKVNYASLANHPKSWVIASHYHPWFEFNYVSKGSLYTTVNKTEFLINAGSSYIIPPGVPHSHRNNAVGDKGICIRFCLNAPENNPVLKTLSAPHEKPFISNIEKLNLTGGLLSTQAEFAAWLMRIFEEFSSEELPAAPPKHSFATQVILYLEEYYTRKIRFCDIANAMNTSYRTLSRKFTAETGMSISDKLTEIRLEKAKELLISTKLSMYDIASLSGYENEFYFSRIFKQKEKISPKAYRSLYKIKLHEV